MTHKKIIEAADWLKFRQPGKRVGLALGVFDFCHEGHVNLLRRAASACDLLVVGVHTDERVMSYKGVRPANSQLERLLAIEQLGIADKVQIMADRRTLCKKFSIDVIFHGDDWDVGQYRKQWGEELIAELNLDIEMVPHTPGINSTTLRQQTPKIGWWLHSSVPDWTRVHFFDHFQDLYRGLGGIWIASRRGRDLVRKHFPEAPCFLLEDGLSSEDASNALAEYELEVVVALSFRSRMKPVLTTQGHQIQLVVLSHGRSGKKGASADASRRLGAGGKPVSEGGLLIHDWSHDPECYNHLDGFLRAGGSFNNPVPELDRPKVLILPTWSVSEDAAGLLQNKKWGKAFSELSDRCDLVLAPHPLADRKTVQHFLDISGARLLETGGRSFEEIPAANCAVCDLSGVFWEAMLFDTPVVLAEPESGYSWPDELYPTYTETRRIVPFVRADSLVPTILDQLKKRVPEQADLAASRLGIVDGKATERIVGRIKKLMKEKS